MFGYLNFNEVIPLQILKRYLLKEWLGSFGLSLLVFTFVLFIGNLLKLAELLVGKGANLPLILKLFVFQLPYFLSYTIPMSVISSSLLAFGRLSADNEILAIRASGIKLSSIILPFFFIGIILSLTAFTINNRLLPYTYQQAKNILQEIGTRFPVLPQFDESVLINDFENYKIYIGRVENQQLKDLTIIYTPPEQSNSKIIFSAKEGTISSGEDKKTISIILQKGSIHELDSKNSQKYHKINFTQHILKLPKEFNFSTPKKLKEMTIRELKSALKYDKNSLERYPLFTEIHKKISLSFSCFVFFLISIPLGIQTKKTAKSTNFGLSLLLIIIYYLFLVAGKALGEKGLFPPYLVMWLPNILLGTLGIFLLYRLEAR